MNRRTLLRRAATVLPYVSATALPQVPAGRAPATHLILFTSDGVRWQDLFTGIDPKLMNQKAAGMENASALRDELWRSSSQGRREALMPFFWRELVPRGILFGNLQEGSSMQVLNRYRISYPGYSEILTGRTQDDVIRENKPIQNPTPSLFQFLKNKQQLEPEQVAVFASWDNFRYSATSRPGDVFVNAGYEPLSLLRDPQTQELSKLQFEARFTEDSARHDAFTFRLAMNYLKNMEPQHLFISFDETDDWAHARRYDRVLQSLEYLDSALKQLWTFLQSSPKYRDKTLLVITTDHGRGSAVDDFSEHGANVAGAQQIWAAFIGPNVTQRGEAKNLAACYQRDIAPTILQLLGIDYREYSGVEGKPIPAASEW